MGLIYKLISSYESQTYVGKTMLTDIERFNQHKRDYKAWLKGTQHYKSSYELIKHNDCTITVLESDIADDMLSAREGYWHSQLDCANRYVPNRSQKQYHEDHREDKKRYSLDNRKRISAYKAQKVVCSCGCVISRSSKFIHLRSPKHKSLMNTIKDT